MRALCSSYLSLDFFARTLGESSVFVLDTQTSECLHYVHLQGHSRQKAVHIPRQVLKGHPSIEIRNDLIDCSVDVCSVEVRLSFLLRKEHVRKTKHIHIGPFAFPGQL